MSTSRSAESRVLAVPLEKVWPHLKTLTFKFWSAVKSVDVEGSVPEAVGSIRRITFSDGTVQRFRVLEISELDHFVTYEIIESSPAINYLAAVHTIRVRTVTHDNSTFVEYVSEFAASANTIAAVEDSKYKKREIFADLAKSLGV